MEPFLTTITPYWKRPEVLRAWVSAMRGASTDAVRHLVYFVGEAPPSWWATETSANMEAVHCPEPPGKSIGHYHNLGAERAQTEWIMKLDVDTFPNVRYFKELVKVLQTAKPREWFNGGMLYLNASESQRLLSYRALPVAENIYQWVMDNLHVLPLMGSYHLPAATNFICRRQDYLALGGCDSRFQGYGWEDYQQIYALERFQRQGDPLPGPVCLNNVTQRCRDEISRRKALQLWRRNRWLCLLHHYHPGSHNPAYKSPAIMQRNREILLQRIQDNKP